ncbi:MAG: TetR/AcrR family transcriptional regulator [Myxococcota bacterium]
MGQHHGDLALALIRSTLELIEQGTTSPSLREVARHAGVSQAAPYHHFGSRAGLLAAAATAGFLALDDTLTSVQAPEPKARLREIVTEYVLFALERWHLYHTMFDPDLPDDPSLLQAAVQTFERLVEAVAALDPESSAELHLERARRGWALAHGAIALNSGLTQLGAPEDGEDFARDVAEGAVKLALPDR